MKRVGNLWPELVSFSNLVQAAKAAAAGKKARPNVAAFLLDLEPNLLRLQRELCEDRYRPGPYRTFQVLDPKPRQISAAPFQRSRGPSRAHARAGTRVRAALLAVFFCLPDGIRKIPRA